MTAMPRLAAGPAAATQAMPMRGFLKFWAVTGTGLAQPNRKGLCRTMRIAGISSVPMGSTCLMGLRVSRPSIRAVGSPSLLATQPWATSWTVMAKRMGMPYRNIFWIRVNSGIPALYRPVSGAEGRRVASSDARQPGCLARQVHHRGRLETAGTAVHDQLHLVLEPRAHLLRVRE